MKKKSTQFLLALFASFCYIHSSKAELLIFEYKYQTDVYGEFGGDFCYYILVLDTARMKGVFCSSSCYFGPQGILFLETEITCINSYDKDEIIYYPTLYHYQTNDLKWGQYRDSTWMKNKDFHFGYRVKDNWMRLEHTDFYVDPIENKKRNKRKKEQENDEISGGWGSGLLSTISLSDFLKEYEVYWFPPYMRRVEQLDMDKIPEYYREDFEDCVEGRF